jgi:proline iminopeptidase
MRRVSAVLLVLVGLVIGVLGSSPVFFAAASYVYSPVLLVLIATAFVALVTAVTAWAGLRVARGGRPAAKGLMLAASVGTVCLVAAYFMLLRPPGRPVAMPPPGPEVQYWQLPTGSRIAYVKAPAVGQPRPTPVIMLHGGPGGPMLPFCLKLGGRAPLETLPAVGYDVYYYDQMGCGYSSRLDLRREPPYTVARSVKDLEAIRAAIGAEKVVLVGWSWGAFIAAHYMLGHPGRVEKAILEAPAPLVVGRQGDFVPGPPLSQADAARYAQVMRRTFRIEVGRQLANRNSPAAFHLVPDWEVDQWLEDQYAEMLRLRQIWGSCDSAREAALAPALGLKRGSGVGFFLQTQLVDDAANLEDARPRLREDRTPTLVVHPQCDILTWASALEYRRVLPNSRLVPIADAGHMIWYDQPQVHASVIEAFLTDAPLPIADYVKDTPPWQQP